MNHSGCSPVFCPLLGVEVPSSVYTDGAEVRPELSEAHARFLGIEPSQRAALFADYREVVKAVGEGPEVASPEQARVFVRWTNVIVPRQGVGSCFVFVQGDPVWVGGTRCRAAVPGRAVGPAGPWDGSVLDHLLLGVALRPKTPCQALQRCAGIMASQWSWREPGQAVLSMGMLGLGARQQPNSRALRPGLPTEASPTHCWAEVLHDPPAQK